MLQLFCPHQFSIGGTLRGCLNGRFLCDCETCDCKDKKYYDVRVTTGTGQLETPSHIDYFQIPNEVYPLPDDKDEFEVTIPEGYLPEIVGTKIVIRRKK